MMKGKYMPVSFEWLQSFFSDVLPEPNTLSELITNGTFEIEEMETNDTDAALDVKVLPDRAGDCFSHRGIAKEISVLTGLPLTKDILTEPFPELSPVADSVVLENDTDTCRGHVLVHVRGIKVAPSPDWLRRRLESVGQRSINNVVDITNYVMFELGQPVHAFDWHKLAEVGGTRGIRVRQAHEGETVTLLGGKEVVLTDIVAVLADAHSDEALDIAGIKGGTRAELTDATIDVLITVANFHPTAVRVASRAVDVRTDASRRFEHNLPQPLIGYAAARVVELLTDIAGGELAGYATYNVQTPVVRDITVSVSRINRLLGTALSVEEMSALLKKQGLKQGLSEDVAGGDELLVRIPFERLDLNIWQDIAEEVGRVYGYNNVPDVALPIDNKELTVLPSRVAAETVRATLTEQGFTEVYTYSLRDEGQVTLKNALAEDKSAMRANLADGIREALARNAHNAPLLGVYDAVKIFEIGAIYPTVDTEEVHVALGVRQLVGKNKEGKEKEIIDTALQAVAEACALDDIRAETVDGAAEVPLTVFVTNEKASEYPDAPRVALGTMYAPIATYPFVLRDLALWASNGTTAEQILSVIRDSAGALLVRADLFDEFSKEGRTSYAFHLVFQSNERTLTDGEVGEVMKQVETTVMKEGWEVR